MPEGRLTLSLANNSLDRVPPMDFFTRTLAADFTSNKIAVIDVELLSSDDVLLDLNTLSCTCNLTWFPLWVQQARSTRYTHMTCITSRGDSLMLLNATDADLGCGLEERDTSAYKLTLISVAVVVVVAVILLAVFRYEVLVLIHALRAWVKRKANRRIKRSHSGAPG
nr:hypothetical protein BaRGS_007808 [Batillaria attramentaria]